MGDRSTDDDLRDLVERIKERLRDAERLRNHVEQWRRQPAFWPDRRRSSRVPDLDDSSHSHDSYPDDRRSR
jgi:hypothetical protein